MEDNTNYTYEAKKEESLGVSTPESTTETSYIEAMYDDTELAGIKE